jgi:hypothetical protein
MRVDGTGFIEPKLEIHLVQEQQQLKYVRLKYPPQHLI